MAQACSNDNQNPIAVPSPKDACPWLPTMQDPLRQIRLLSMPKGSDPEQQVELRVANYDLSQVQGTYHALSYTWGTPHTESSDTALWQVSCAFNVVCNGHDVQVTQSLFEGLQLIIPQLSSALLWVDALCIDQSDNDERLCQVSVMGDIFQQAAQVTVWLGTPVTEENAQRLQQFDRLYQAHSRHDHHDEGAVPADGDIATGGRPRAHWADQFSDKTLSNGSLSLNDIARRKSWWNRKWTFQEAVLARSTVIRYGIFCFEVKQIRRLISSLKEYEKSGARERMLHSFNYGGSFFLLSIARDILFSSASPSDRAMTVMMSVTGDTGTAAVLLTLLVMTQQRRATRQEDVVLSILGLAKVLVNRLGLPLNYHEFIDFSLPAADLFLAVTRYIYLQSTGLALLNAAANVETSDDRPSWLPDFQNLRPHYGVMAFSKLVACGTETLGRVKPVRRFGLIKASGTAYSERVQGFSLRGRFFGTIQKSMTVETCGDRTDFAEQWPRLKCILWFCEALPTRYRQSHGPDERILPVVTGCGNVQDGGLFKVWILAVLTSFLALRPQSSSSEELQSFQSTTEWSSILGFDPIQLAKHSALTLEDIYSWTPSRREEVGSTLRIGRYNLVHINQDTVGNTHAKGVIGDQIWILEGGRWAYVLRPTRQPHVFRYIGPAYVEGIMSGEFAPDARSSASVWTPIWLI